MAGVAAGGQAADAELKLVAVRAGEADAAVELARADFKQGLPQRLLGGAHPLPVGALALAASALPGESNERLYSIAAGPRPSPATAA